LLDDNDMIYVGWYKKSSTKREKRKEEILSKYLIEDSWTHTTCYQIWETGKVLQTFLNFVWFTFLTNTPYLELEIKKYLLVH
jgi:hypothetical protein